jgi:hypothetical protein
MDEEEGNDEVDKDEDEDKRTRGEVDEETRNAEEEKGEGIDELKRMPVRRRDVKGGRGGKG